MYLKDVDQPFCAERQLYPMHSVMLRKLNVTYSQWQEQAK